MVLPHHEVRARVVSLGRPNVAGLLRVVQDHAGKQSQGQRVEPKTSADSLDLRMGPLDALSVEECDGILGVKRRQCLAAAGGERRARRVCQVLGEEPRREQHTALEVQGGDPAEEVRGTGIDAHAVIAVGVLAYLVSLVGGVQAAVRAEFALKPIEDQQEPALLQPA